MLSTKIDRYVSSAVLVRFVGMLCLIGALYASFDLLKRLEEVEQGRVREQLATFLTYYAHVLPMFLLDIAPGVLLLAAGIVMVRMAAAGELLALKASGASLYRVMAPVFFWALVVSVVVFVTRETAGSQIARRRDVLDRVLENDVESALLVRDPGRDRKVFIGEYSFADGTMKSVTVFELRPSGKLSRMVRGDAARLAPDGTLELQQVEVRHFDEAGIPNSKPELAPSLEVATNLTPLALAQAAEEGREEGMMLHTLRELRAQMQRNPGVPFFAVAFHARLASFFSPLILLLVGLPCLVGFERSVNSRFLSAIISMLLATGLYGLTFLFNSMGNTGSMPPVLAGWLPAIITGALGLWLFESVHT